MIAAALLSWVYAAAAEAAEERGELVLQPRIRLTNPAARDQDDMVFCVDRQDAARSAVIVSDKEANHLFVYDLQGQVLQQLPLQHPGNVDLREGFVWGGAARTIVVVNERDTQRLAVLAWDPALRSLQRIDDGNVATGENYGGTLFHHRPTGRFFFVYTSKTAGVHQVELVEEPAGVIRGREVRMWPLRMCEGAVADDATGQIYVSVEQEGVYRLDGDPHSTAEPRLCIRLGQHGLVGDVEGLALARVTPERAFLIISDQGPSRFRVYEVAEEARYKGSFTVADACHTDGIDVTLAPLGPELPAGAFACHTDLDDGRTVLVCPAIDLLQAISCW